MKRPRLGLALGSGSARGWAHLGVIQALEERGIRPDVVCGASVGALVAGAYASGQLPALESWVRELSRADVWRLLDASLRGGGFMRGERLMAAIAARIEDRPIESLPIAFAAAATDLETGHEVWLREGPMLTAVRASSGLPGLFSPVRTQDRWLIDGGVVNPVPVSLCVALGADEVIAVNLNAHLAARTPEPDPSASAPAKQPPSPGETAANGATADWWSELLDGLLETFRSDGSGGSDGSDESQPTAPGIFDVMWTSINIMQDRITRSRMAGDPPSVVLAPNLGDFKLMDFHRAGEAIEIGRSSVERAEEDLARLRSRPTAAGA